MKKILISLTLILTISIASTKTITVTNNQNISTLIKDQIVLREVRTSRTAPEARKIRKNRLVIQTSRKGRELRHVVVQEQLHFASLK